MRFLSLFVVMAFGLIAGAQGAENRLYAGCDLRERGESSDFLCDFRSREPKSVRDVRLSANGEALDEAVFTSFSDGVGKAVWLFLIDRSNPRRAATVRRSVELVERLYARSNARNIMAVATFAGEMQVLISPGDPYADVADRLKDVRADGAATAFYFTALQAMDILQNVDAERRALVIISDGKAEDTAYTHADVVERARRDGVIIYGIGFAERPSETVDLQQVQRLASETGGPFVSAIGDAPLPTAFLDDFTRYLTNGGEVSAPAGDISGEISARLEVAFDDGTSLTSEPMGLYIESPPEPVVMVEPEPEVVPPPLPLIGKIYRGFEGVWSGASDWAAANGVLAWLLLLLPLIVLVLILALMLLRRRDEAATDSAFGDEDDGDAPVTQVVSGDEMGTTVLSHEGALGYFENPADGARFDIREQNVTIGRHSENDYQLDDETVHRHHAVFHISPDGQPLITDLDTVNGVVVNGKRVSKAELHSGDVIELGEAKFRFVTYA